MPCSRNSHLSFWGFLQTKSGLWTFKGVFFILWLSLCPLAECGDVSKAARSTATLPKDNYRIKVTFDPNTAYPRLKVSEDKTYVEHVDRPQNVPDNPERFNSTPSVLGLQVFTSGKHYWEVEYGSQREWAVGVAFKSVERKKNLQLSEEEGIFQTGLWWLRTLENSSHTLPTRRGIIGVFLDQDANSVAFFLDGKVIKRKGQFKGEELLPFFYVGGGVHLTLI